MTEPTYREGVMAERRRVILLTLAATNRVGGPSDDGHAIAHKISDAGDYLPPPTDQQQVDQWSVFGERRVIREVPTFLESSASPFTDQGRRRMERLETDVATRGPRRWAEQELLKRIDAQAGIISELRTELGKAPKEIEQLHALVDDLRRQLSGVIG